MKKMFAHLEPLKWLARHPMTRQRPSRVFSRWAYWQVRQVFTSSPKIMPYIGGTRLEIRPHEGLTAYWYVELPDYDEMTFLLRFLKESDVFYDIGANAGAFSILAASRGCDVVALEPIPQTFSRLTANVELNRNFGRITAVNMAAGARAEHLIMTTGKGTGNHIIKPGQTTDGIEVKVLPLDHLAQIYDAPTFLKIDVEGHELEVIRGMPELLKQGKILGFLIETFRPHNWKLPRLQELEEVLSQHGFRPCEYDSAANQMRELTEPSSGSDNTFYFRDLDMVRERLKAAS